MSYGLLNWWWGEEIKGPTDYLAKWWKHQRDTFLTDFKINPPTKPPPTIAITP